MKKAILRTLPVLALIVVTITVYEWGTGGVWGENRFRARDPENVQWEDSRKGKWAAFSYCPLDDRNRLELKAENAFGSSSSISNRLDADQIAELPHAIAKTLYAMGATDWQDYVDQIDGLRRIPESPYESKPIPAHWKQMTGSPMATDLTYEEVFNEFWNNRLERPRAVSIENFSGFSVSVGKRDSHLGLTWVTSEQEDLWQNFAASSLVPMTLPIELPGTAITVVSLETVIETESGRHVPVHLGFEWFDRWALTSMSVQLDENLFWPF